ELVGREDELPDPLWRPLRVGLRTRPRRQRLLLVADPAAPRRLAVGRRRRLGGEDERQRGTRAERRAERPGMEVVLDGVEPARAEHVVADVRRVSARLYPHALLEKGVRQRIGPDWCRTLEAEPLDLAVSAWVHCPTRPAVRTQRQRQTIVLRGLFDFGDE